MVGEKKRLHIVVGALLRLHLAGFSGPVAELAATGEGSVVEGWAQLGKWHSWN